MKSTLVLGCLMSAAVSSAQSCWQDTICTGPTEAAFSGPWDDYIYSPASRTVSPRTTFPLDDVSSTSVYGPQIKIIGNATAYVYDFGQEVGGIATINYTTTGGAGQLGLAFTEAKNWIGLASDSSNGQFSRGYGDQACDDGAIYSDFITAGNYSYTMSDTHLRGGFRYMTLFLLTNSSSTTLSIDSVSLSIAFEPTWSNLRAYQGYFYSNDEELNKIWYSGAYTLQTNAVPMNRGRQYPFLTSGWANNGTLSNGTTVIVDGAKRDRAVWPGDMGIAVPSTFVSTSGLDSVSSALQTMYDHQNSDGSFPEAGPPLLQQGSDTYHCWTMIGTYNYVLFTNDTAFLELNWVRYQVAMNYIYAKVLQPYGLLNVTGARDWAREASSGNYTEANAILYHTLTTGANLATWSGNETLSALYSSRAAELAKNMVEYLYVPSYGAFKDNTTDTALYPQDGNSMALLFGVVPNNSAMAQSISQKLTKNWTPIGPDVPELPNNISPFISGFEIQGHFTAGNTMLGLDLIRRTWGWYLHNANGSESTVIEGFLTNGSFGYRNYRGYNYDSSYPSHSHGWSSGPTSALTNYILGLSVTDRAGSRWLLAPQFGDLESVQGGFTSPLGQFQASWNITDSGRGYDLEWTTPAGTEGLVRLPGLPAGGQAKVMIDGTNKATVRPGESYTLSSAGGSRQRAEVQRV